LDNEEEAFTYLMGKDSSNYYGLGASQQSSYRSNLFPKVVNGMERLEDIFLDADLVNKHGVSPAITFLDLVRLRQEFYALGIMFSKKNKSAFQFKEDYLIDLIDRGADIGKTKEEVQAMTPNQILELFATIEEILESIYGENDDLDNYIKQHITEEAFARITSPLGLEKIKTKNDYLASAKGRDKEKKEEKEKIREAFFNSNISLYYIQTRSIREEFERYLKRLIHLSLEMYRSLDAETKEKSVLTINNLSADQFLEMCGIGSENTIDSDIDDLNWNHKLAIARQFFPELHTLYRRRTVELKNFTDAQKGKALDIKSVLQQILAERKEEPLKKPPFRLPLPKFLAKLFDSLPESTTHASTRYISLMKEADISKMKKIIDLKKKAQRANVDTRNIDLLLRKLKDEQRKFRK
jgi:hypothetical protein